MDIVTRSTPADRAALAAWDQAVTEFRNWRRAADCHLLDSYAAMCKSESAGNDWIDASDGCCGPVSTGFGR